MNVKIDHIPCYVLTMDADEVKNLWFAGYSCYHHEQLDDKARTFLAGLFDKLEGVRIRNGCTFGRTEE